MLGNMTMVKLFLEPPIKYLESEKSGIVTSEKLASRRRFLSLEDFSFISILIFFVNEKNGLGLLY